MKNIRLISVILFGMFIVMLLISAETISYIQPDNVTGAVKDTGAINVIAAYYLGYRLFDTLFEILVFTVAVQGVVHLLGHMPTLEQHKPMREKAIIIYTDLIFGASLITGMYIAVAGHISAGGGFVGGIVGATGAVLVFLTMPMEDIEKEFNHTYMAIWEMCILATIFALVLLPIFIGMYPMKNFLPLGTPGHIVSGGIISIVDTLIGIKVLIGAVTIAQTFIKHRGVF
ncbi:hypothetical protein GM182_02800 [bacterium 3DAC]|nr:hypothetical protein GM182_02800 [bacterium 3DAC]